MVLQAGVPVPIWGKANPGETVSVEFADQKKTCQVGADGHWSVKLDALAVSAQPRVLKVGSRVLADVLVGEVWLCSGQSNMQWLVGKLGSFPGVEHGEEEIAAPERPNLRLFSDEKDPNWKARGWRHCGGEDLRAFSATAYFFGKALQRELGIPVGLINSSRGGSSIQSWTPKDYALRNPVTRHYLNLFQQHHDDINAFNQAHNRARLAREAGRANIVFPSPLPRELEISRRFSGTTLFDNCIDPIAPYALRGVVWYQGESNASFPETARVYDSMLRDLIEGWRARWGQTNLPWVLVQLPCWTSNEETNWPWVRQGQLVASQTIPQVSMVTTCDFGDVTNLHPPQKRELGERLVTLVLARIHGRNLVCSGPTVQSVRRLGAKLRVEFATGGAPIRFRNGAWDNVEMAGEHGVFHPATAMLTADAAVLASDAVALPSALRYGWTNVFRPSLFNEAGLPASPFALVVGPDGTFQLSQH